MQANVASSKSLRLAEVLVDGQQPSFVFPLGLRWKVASVVVFLGAEVGACARPLQVK